MELAENDECSTRVKLIVKNMLENREQGWEKSKKQSEKGPKKVEELRKEMEEKAKQDERQRQLEYEDEQQHYYDDYRGGRKSEKMRGGKSSY